MKTWGQFIKWLMATYGVKWPERPFQFADYLISRALEPCGRSIPVNAYKTLVFMEHAAEIPKDLPAEHLWAQSRTPWRRSSLGWNQRTRGRENKLTQLLVVMVAALWRGKLWSEGAPQFSRGLRLVQAGQGVGCDEVP